MSNTKKLLSEIASGTEYKALAAAIEKVDYQAIFDSYMQIYRLINNGKGRIEEGIKSLPVQSKNDHLDKFKQTFDVAIERILPLWHQLNLVITRKQIMEGEVFSIGKKGDPLVRTPQGRIIALRGTKLELGDKVTFVVEYEGEKVGMGRVFNLDAQSFYNLITQEPRERIRKALASIEDRMKASPANLDKDSLSLFGELLAELEGIKKFPASFNSEEQKRVISQVLIHRKRLIHDMGVKFMFDFLSRQEEKEIEDFFQDRLEEKTKALSALGLFRRQTYEAAEKLIPGDKSEELGQAFSGGEDEVNSMASIMKLMDFKDSIDRILPKAKSYLDSMNRIFDNLTRRVRQVTDALSESDTVDPEEIRQAIKKAFGEDALSLELKASFRTSREFLSLRGAYSELVKKLKDQESIAAETAFRSYLNHKILQVFGSKKP